MQLEECIAATRLFGELGKGTEEANSFPRLNGDAQDTLKLLKLFQFKLSLLVPQFLNFEEVQSGQATLRSWKEQYHKLHMSLRSANFQAKANIRKSALEERELLLGGGEESTARRTKAGMTSAAESITNSLRLSRQLMVQEVEISANTLATFDESTSVLRKAESEYHGHRSLLMRTRGLLSTMHRQGVLDWQDHSDHRISHVYLGNYVYRLQMNWSAQAGKETCRCHKIILDINQGHFSKGPGPTPQGAPLNTGPPIYDEI